MKTPLAQGPVRSVSDEALTAYWTRTLSLFAGLDLRILLLDGRIREGRLTPQSRLVIASGEAIPVPLGLVRSVESL